MPEEGNSRGISRRTFVAGILIAIVISIVGGLVVLQITGLMGPEPRPTRAKWDVSWRIIGDGYRWQRTVGTSEFPATFSYNWGSDLVFERGSQSYYNYIGFRATMSIYLEESVSVTFTVESDDGSRLYVDGAPYIDSWYTHGYFGRTIQINLLKGHHTLTLEYFEWGGGAAVSFDCNNEDIFILKS